MSQSGGTAAIAKRSLGHFAIGRILSALVGVGFLLLLVRVLERESYGIYIALFAAFEIIQLAATPGGYAFVFRYLPELRSNYSGRELARVTTKLVGYRFATLLLAAFSVWLFRSDISQLAGFPIEESVISVFALVIVFEGMARFVDMVFESLLSQGYAQVSILFRNGIKLSVLAIASDLGSNEIDLSGWLTYEAMTSAVGALLSCILLLRRIRPERQSEKLEDDKLAFNRIAGFCAPTYLSQVTYIASGTEMVKLLVSKLIGASTTAAFGFAALLAGTIQRYLPSFLLIGWVRPLLITAKNEGKGYVALVELSGVIVKLNLLVLSPICVVLIVGGSVIVDLISGGKLPDSLPFIYFFLVLIFAQTIRSVVSLLGVALEVGSGSLKATLISLIGLSGGVIFYPEFGSWALCGGLLATEAIWTLAMVFYLRAHGMYYKLPFRSILKFLFCVILSAAGGLLFIQVFSDYFADSISIFISAAASAIVCLLTLMLARPFNGRERELINRMLPMKLFVW